MDPVTVTLPSTFMQTLDITIPTITQNFKKRKTCIDPPSTTHARRVSGEISRLATQDDFARIEIEKLNK